MKKVFSTSFLVSFFTILTVGLVFWDIYLYTLNSHTTQINYWFNIYGSISIFVAVVGFASYYLGQERRSAIARSILWLSWGALANGLGLFYWLYNNVVHNISVPYPSLGEYLFLSFPILIYIGSAYLLLIYRPLVTARIVVEGLLVTIISSALIFHYFILPNLGGVHSFFGQFVTVSIPWEDAFTIALVYTTLRVSGGKMRNYLWLFIVNLLLLIAGDFVFQYRNAVGVYWNGDIADLLYVLNMYFYALAVIYIIDRSGETLTAPNTDPTIATTASSDIASPTI